MKSYLDLLRAEKHPLHRLLDSDVIGPTHDSSNGRLDQVFRKRPTKEREASVSLSVFPNDFDIKVAAAVMGVIRIIGANRIPVTCTIHLFSNLVQNVNPSQCTH